MAKLNPDGTAQVLHLRRSACSGDCHKCSGCGAVQERLLFSAENPIRAAEGDLVRVSANSRTVLLSAVVLYMIPVVLFFAGYLIGSGCGLAEELTACVAFAVGIAIAILYDRKILSRKKVTYTITGFAQNIETEG